MKHDVTVLNNCSIRSDHRMVRSKIVLNARKERRKMLNKRQTSRWTRIEDKRAYEEEIDRRLGEINKSNRYKQCE